MALAITFPQPDYKEVSVGNLRAKLIEVTPAAGDYTTNGYQPVGGWAKFCGLRTVVGMEKIGGAPGWAKLIVHYDSTNDKLMCMYPSGGGAASPAALADPAITAGAVAVTSNAANGASDLTPGQAKEVANATDLSGLGVLRLLVLGN